ncbi:MAG: alpha/beta hydrolase [Sinimarinibacterium sp.]|jgi:4,5:9,10-diseco-3-hydroxy-5,9,17-trioxoandrosta-1(10),2-diene-4-oate hydrolase
MNTASHRVLLSGGLELHYHEAGRGEPLVFLHGGGPGASGQSNYQRNFTYFAERGYRVLMPDLIGWGQSSKPAGLTYNFELLAGSLRAWLRALNIERCSFVGNAMGGSVALSLALDTPALVSRLVLLAPAGIADPQMYAQMPGLKALITLVTGGRPYTAESMRELFALMYHSPLDIDERVVAERTAAANTQPADLYANLKLDSHKDRLHELSCPTLLFWGASDNFCPLESSSGFLKQCSGARLVAVAACGHWLHFEQAELFNRLTLDFLRNG